MPVANIEIKGIIGSYEDEQGQLIKGVELVDVASQIHKALGLGADSLDVYIDSPGGRCTVGYKIYDLLKAQKIPIRTIVVNECCSIATVIYLAGDTREPILGQEKFMIHNPWIMNISGNADELLEASEEIRVEEEKMLSFYSKITGVDKSLLSPLMSAESYLNPDQLLQFNFSTPQITYTGAIAFKREPMSKEALGIMDKIKSKLGIKKELLALQLTDSNGTVLDIQSESEAIMIGDAVMIAGQPAPDGDYLISETNMTVTIAGGVITNLVDNSQATDDTSIATENETLKIQVAELTAKLAKAKEFETEVTETFAMIEKSLPNDYTPPARKQVFAKAVIKEDKLSLKERMEKSKESYKKK